MNARSEKTGVTAEHILSELLKIATSDVGDAFDEMGQMKPLNQMSADTRRAIASIEVHEIFEGQGSQKTAIGLARKLKFWDKPKALELLGKHLKLYTDKIEHDVTDALALRLESARQRLMARKPR